MVPDGVELLDALCRNFFDRRLLGIAGNVGQCWEPGGCRPCAPRATRLGSRESFFNLVHSGYSAWNHARSDALSLDWA